ncbi:MAG: FkbM family methyltransferase [Chlamydiota bacterium]
MKRNVLPQYLELYPYYGRHGQDRIINKKIFRDLKKGTFVDIGAYDGVESSNTLFFEESLNWNGICIEPLQNIYPKLQSNRTSRTFNCCALDRYGTHSFQHIIPTRFAPSSSETRLSNVEKLSGLVEYLSADHKQMAQKMIDKVGGKREYYEVESVPINDLLAELSSPIDLLSLDTEGSEFCILKAINFARFPIKVIVVEVLFYDAIFVQFMQSKGYQLIDKIGYDWVYQLQKKIA